MLVRHNINIYADELERVVGGIRICMDGAAEGAEAAYWLGALNALRIVHGYDTPDTWEGFVVTLKNLYDGGDGAAVVRKAKKLMEGEQNA